MFKKDHIVGIDIGSYSVKAAELAVREGGPCLVKAELKEIGISEDAESYEEETISALKYIVRGMDLKRSKTIVSINCSYTAVKKVTVPYMPKSELREGIMLEAKSYFPFRTDQSVLDFEVMGDVVEKGIRKYEVMVGVCPLNTVNKYLSLVHKAGIKPASFISVSYALQKLAQELSRKASGTLCYVDIGHLHTELIICKDGALVFSRKIPVFGNDFTKAMTASLISEKGKVQFSTEEAEKIKCDIGMPQDNDSRIIENKIPANQVLAMLRTPAENLANEINRCFDYYREESGSGKINSVTIFGGGASLSGLTKFLSQELTLQVVLGDSMEGLKIENNAVREGGKLSHRIDLAVGATLTEAGGLNLLPSEIKDQAQRIIKRGTIEVIVTAVVIISLMVFIGMKIKIGNFDKRIATSRMELASLQPQLKIAEARKIAETVLVNEPYWEDVFKELGSLIPDTVLVDSIKMENAVIEMKGRVDAPDGQQILANFIITLENGLFDNVKLVESRNLPSGAGVEFKLKAWIDYEK